jgi:hypothetical protein
VTKKMRKKMSEGEITKGNAGIIYALMLLMFVSGQ